MYLKYNTETKKLEEIQVETNTYEMIRKGVGGLICSAPVPEDLAGIDMWVHDEGKLLQMEPSAMLMDKSGDLLDFYAGNIVFTRTDEAGETIPLTDEDVERIKKAFGPLASRAYGPWGDKLISIVMLTY